MVRPRQPLLRPILLAMTCAGLIVSGISPFERGTWWLEVLPVLIAIPILLATSRRFPITPLVCILLTVHGAILVLGGHYTYANVPIGLWVQEAFELDRNHYDRLGHVAQGFVPAMVAREVLLRCSPLRDAAWGWLFFITTSICLAISAAYELVEWFVALLWNEGSNAFLGTQGDIWDTQWDMLLALIGAMASQVLLFRIHDRQIAAIAPPSGSAV